MAKIKEMVCNNCGARQFRRLGDQLICEYCGSEYLITDEAVKQDKSVEKPRLVAKYWKIGLVFAGLVIVLAGFLGFQHFQRTPTQSQSQTQSRTQARSKKGSHEFVAKLDSSDADQTKYGLLHIDQVNGKWTAQIYESIKVATRNESMVNGKPKTTFTDGTKYQDLLNQVGNPASSMTLDDGWTVGYLATVTLDWESDWDSKQIVKIEITYDKASGMITEKDISGYKD